MFITHYLVGLNIIHHYSPSNITVGFFFLLIGGGQPAWVTKILVRGRIGLSHIRHDKFIVVDEFGERLADDGVNPVGSGLVVDQRHKDGLVLQFYKLAPDLDSHCGYKGLNLLVDFEEPRH